MNRIAHFLGMMLGLCLGWALSVIVQAFRLLVALVYPVLRLFHGRGRSASDPDKETPPPGLHAVVQGQTQSGKSRVPAVLAADRRAADIIRAVRSAEIRRRLATERGDSFEGVFIHGDEWENILATAGVRMSALLLALAAAGSAVAAEGDGWEDRPWSVDVYALGLSHHFMARDADRREVNPGWGVGLSGQLSPAWDISIRGMTYVDSFDRRAVGLAAGLRGYLGDRHGLHATGEILAGSWQGSRHYGRAVVPVVGAGWGPVTVEATADPSDQVAAGWLAFRWEVKP